MDCFVVLLLVAGLALTLAMPYYVPLQGIVGGKRTLVLLDDMGRMQSHSLFFSQLQGRGHSLTYVQAESEDVKLKSFGEYMYDNMVIFAPAVEAFNTITVDDVIEFTTNGGNILLAVDGQMSDMMRFLAESSGVEFDRRGSVVIDHFAFESSASGSDHSGVLVSNAIKSGVILGKYAQSQNSAPVLYRGVGHAVDNTNVLAVKVLRGNPSTYSANPAKSIDDYPENAGADTLLVTAVQARNNARIVISGSLDMFSNSFYRTKQAQNGALVGNEAFCAELSKWAFGEAGVLRFRDINHAKWDGTPPDVILHEKKRPDLPTTLYPDPEITRNSLVYRIKDNIVYTMIVEELVENKWVPYVANDMQMEFVMLDPYVRKTMSADKSGKYSANFMAPDSYGIFKFRVLYRRQGYSVLHAETTVSIRPFKHNEYERFIFAAYPYYASAFSAMIAFFVFSVVFLFSSK
jgi:oligosaccharyltransferase complex subunit beta